MTDYSHVFSRAATAMQGSAIRKMGALGARDPNLISFAPGYPSPEVFAWDDFRDVTAAAFASRDPSVLQYGATHGYGPLVDALPAILRERGITAGTNEVLVTTGSQQALDLCARVFLDPGDVVLVELPTYTGAITAFRDVPAVLAGVRQNAGGIDLEDLDRVLGRERAAGRRVAFLYLVPNFQNPTGMLITLERRRQLLEWASRRNVLIVEDDPYGALYFEDAASPNETRPIKADDTEGRVVYLSSFSKTLAPGLRVAWITAPAEIATKLETAKQAADICTGSLDQRIVFDMWDRGILARRLPVLRAHYGASRRVMEQALRREIGDRVSWTEPRGGFFLWPRFAEIDTDDLLHPAIELGVTFVAGSAFYVDGRRSEYARLAFSAPTHERIEEGIRRLAMAIERTTPLKSGSAAGRRA